MSEYLKTLFNIAQQAGGTATLNLADSTTLQCLTEKYGGESYLVSSAANVERVIQTTKTQHQQGRGRDYTTLLSRRAEANALQDAVYIAHAVYDAANGKFWVRCVGSFTENALVCNMHIDILDKDQKQIGKHYIARKNTHFVAEPESGFISIGQGCAVTGSVFTVMVTVSTMLEGKSVMANVVTTAQFSTDALVKTSDIAHPIKKFNNQDPIYVFYGRYPTVRDHLIDYIYEDALHNVVADVKLDVMGSASFVSGTETVKTVLTDECRAILDMKRGAFRYQNSEGFQMITSTSGGFSWYYDPNWGGTIPTASFQASNQSYLSVMLRYKANSTGDRPQSMMISSFLASDVNPACRSVRMLDLKIGCLAKGTLIRMADDTQHPVEEIRIGDRVVCGVGGETEKVVNTFTGSEETLVVIEMQNDCTVMLSPTHLVKTEKGLVEAQELNAAMRIQTEDGLCAIRFLYSVDNHESVYNLELDGGRKDNLISAGGIYVAEVNTTPPQARETLGLNEDFNSIYREFYAIDRL